MKSMQRKFGGLMKRSADEADVGVVLAEFKAVDDMLERLIKDIKIWHEGWQDILKLQEDGAEAFIALYKPVEPTVDPDMHRTPTETPARYTQKCESLRTLYADVRADLAREIELINKQVLSPAESAKASTKALHRTIKHRENTKLDYERYLSRAEHSRQKNTRSAKEESALAKHENDLAQAKIDYSIADDQVKQTFPPVSAAVLELIPHILTSQVMIHTTLVGQLYTVLAGWSKEHGMPGAGVTDDEIINTWDREFTGFRKEVESELVTLSTGKAVRLSMTLAPEREPTVTGFGLRNRVMNRKASGPPIPEKRPTIGSNGRQESQLQIENGRGDEEEEQAPAKPPRPSASSPIPMPSPSIPTSSKPRIPSVGGLRSPSAVPYPQSPPSYDQVTSTPPSRYQTPLNGAQSPAGLLSAMTAGNQNGNSNGDYFSANLRRTSTTNSTTPALSPGGAAAAAAIAAKKKKPPPPVPAKRIPSQTNSYVIALYDFEGQNEGDLVFREGDRIRVVHRTGSTDDWWEGELKGRVGVFPANYVRV